MRYFIEVSYKGTQYSGFQVQQNAITIQGEVEKALSAVCRFPVNLTGSSRTDAGVHAFQNYFHFDVKEQFQQALIYNINALLPLDIVIQSIFSVPDNAHCRFLAVARQYKYYITTSKNPFVTDTAWYYPFAVDINLLNAAACLLHNYTDFTSFSKRNTQAYTNQCSISKSEWILNNNSLVYTVRANRFLRGMVRGLVGTMLLVGRKKIDLTKFEEIIMAKNCTLASFATPPNGLFLEEVEFPSLFK